MADRELSYALRLLRAQGWGGFLSELSPSDIRHLLNSIQPQALVEALLNRPIEELLELEQGPLYQLSNRLNQLFTTERLTVVRRVGEGQRFERILVQDVPLATLVTLRNELVRNSLLPRPQQQAWLQAAWQMAWLNRVIRTREAQEGGP